MQRYKGNTLLQFLSWLWMKLCVTFAFSHIFRDNAWSLQPGSGPDHPRLCVPGSNGCVVVFRGPAHQGQEQTQAQEASHQAAHIPPAAAAAADDWEKPHSLTLGCWERSSDLLTAERTTFVEKQRWRLRITRCLMNCWDRRQMDHEAYCDSMRLWADETVLCASCLFKAVCGCLCVCGLTNSIRQCYTYDVKHTDTPGSKKLPVSDMLSTFLSVLWPNFLYEWNVSFIFIEFVRALTNILRNTHRNTEYFQKTAHGVHNDRNTPRTHVCRHFQHEDHWMIILLFYKSCSCLF